VVRDLGLTISYARAVGLSSSVNGAPKIGTTFERFDAGLRYRLATGAAPRPLLGFEAAFALDRFVFDAPAAIAPELPSVAYLLLRAAADARVPLGRVSLTARLAYLGAISSGDVYARFHRARIEGVSLGAGLAVAIAAGFEARAGVDYTGWFSSLASLPGDAYVASGAKDEYLTIHLGAAYVY
jgi:hypothetical protein